MGAGKYFKREFSKSKWWLEHDDVSDFYLSCWQKNRASFPLLCFRAVIFLGCLSIVIASMVLTGISMGLGFWPIYMTHWGIVLITVTSGFAFGVSFVAYRKGGIDNLFTLPWHVKVYWVLLNITVTLAFFITAFYYAFLSSLEGIDFAIDPVLDFFIHGMNSILMVALLMTSRNPTNIFHFYFPVVFGLVYLFFSLIYYFSGGTDPFGNSYIYPNLDWQNPGITTITCVLSAVGLILIHFVVVALTLLRDWITRSIQNTSKSVDFS